MAGTDWSDVAGRVARLAASPAAREIPGSSRHGWEFDPPLGAVELAEVEAQLRVELPAEYRSFLLQVGRGGPGPHGGVFALRRVRGRWQWEGQWAELTRLERLDQPFGLVEAFNPADLLPPAPDEEDFEGFETDDALDDAWEDYRNRYYGIVAGPEYSDGLVYLCDRGCALSAMLVVSGPARGQMWLDDNADYNGYAPMVDDNGTSMGFARWYRDWLDAVEAQLGGVGTR